MYDIENAGHAMGFHKRLMMENAGAAAVRRLLDEMPPSPGSVLVFAGLGNNGGDGLVMARHLAGHGCLVYVRLLGRPEDIKTQECRDNYNLLAGMPSVKMDTMGPKPDAIIDAILGTGITGDIREPHASAIEYINGSGAFVLAVDVPSGMNPDTGDAASRVVRADMTVTFHRMKRGIPRRPDLTGKLHVEPIGIPPEAEEGIL